MTSNIPVGIKNEIKILKIKSKTCLYLSDTHSPFHDEIAIQRTIQFIKKEYKKIDVVILGGDIIDFWKISKFTRIPSDITSKIEINTTKLLLEWIRNQFPKSDIYYIQGNHEYRLDVFRSKFPEFFIDETSLSSILKLDSFNILLLKYKQPIQIENTMILHGNELPQKIFKNPIQNSILGHFHISENKYSLKRLDEQIFTSYYVGCLCQLQQEWLPFNSWKQGFAVIQDGEVFNYCINRDKINRVF